ncbi:hypothetical protein LTR94_032502, partial [Friedmanniomyces endolithicus]
ALFGGPTDLWDVDQVEILRGPQSTIQGLNSLAGAIVLTTRDASVTDYSADGRILWTDRNDRTFSVAAGGPLIRDELGIRLSAERRADRGQHAALADGHQLFEPAVRRHDAARGIGGGGVATVERDRAVLFPADAA